MQGAPIKGNCIAIGTESAQNGQGAPSNQPGALIGDLTFDNIGARRAGCIAVGNRAGINNKLAYQ